MIRPARPDDAAALEKLRASVGWSTAETGLSSMSEGRAVIYMLEIGGVPVASGALGLQSHDRDLADGSQVALLSNLIVHPAHQGSGLGSCLIAYIEDQARARGVRWLTIGVDQPNVRARKLYERRGYRWFKDKKEPWGPVHFLRKPLTVPREGAEE